MDGQGVTTRAQICYKSMAREGFTCQVRAAIPNQPIQASSYQVVPNELCGGPGMPTMARGQVSHLLFLILQLFLTFAFVFAL